MIQYLLPIFLAVATYAGCVVEVETNSMMVTGTGIIHKSDSPTSVLLSVTNDCQTILVGQVYSNAVFLSLPNPAYSTWKNGVGAAWRWDTINGNFDVARANISAFLTSTNFPAYTVGQVSGANQDAWTINAAQIIGTQPPATLPTP